MSTIDDAMAKGKKEEEKVTIHEKGGDFDSNMTIYEIEEAVHPRAKEKIKEELTSILEEFVRGHVEGGNIKDPEKAADDFLELFGKYHFGEIYGDLDKKHVRRTLETEYGISRNALKSAFKRKGVYTTPDMFYKLHVDPHVDKIDENRKTEAQRSLDFYLKDADARGEIPEHLETRTGLKLSDKFTKVLDLGDVVKLISHYMNLPGSVEKIGEDKKASLGMPKAVAGHPDLYDLFDGGVSYHEAYKAEAKKVAASPRLKSKK